MYSLTWTLYNFQKEKKKDQVFIKFHEAYNSKAKKKKNKNKTQNKKNDTVKTILTHNTSKLLETAV